MGKRSNFPKPDDFRPVPDWPSDHTWHGQGNRCQAWNPVDGRQCMRRALKGKRVCKKDGGASLAGIAHPNYQGKGYSRYMPDPIAPAFQRALNDPDLLALNVDIATVEALIDDVMHRVTNGDPVALFKQMRNLWGSLWAATAREDSSGIRRIRGQFTNLLEEGAAQAAAVDTLLDLTEQKRKLVDTEGKRREKMQEYVRAEEVAVAYRALGLAVKKHEDDPVKLAAIADEFERLVALHYFAGAETSEV